MSSTNKTSHYDLSQYTASDKPTYLVDYNADMSAIDTGIYNAQTSGNEANANIGTMSNLTTTDKSSLVGAINELDSDLGTLDGTVGNHTTAIAQNTGNIGTMANLTTNDKTSLVNAIDEVNYNVNNFNLTQFHTLTASDITSSKGSTIQWCDIQYATNSDGSLAKIYGKIEVLAKGGDTLSFQTTLRPSSDININGHVMRVIAGSNGTAMQIYNWNYVTMTIHTDGTVSVPSTYVYNSGVDVGNFFFTNSLLFIKDFGDSPIPEPTPNNN